VKKEVGDDGKLKSPENNKANQGGFEIETSSIGEVEAEPAVVQKVVEKKEETKETKKEEVVAAKKIPVQ